MERKETHCNCFIALQIHETFSSLICYHCLFLHIFIKCLIMSNTFISAPRSLVSWLIWKRGSGLHGHHSGTWGGGMSLRVVGELLTLVVFVAIQSQYILPCFIVMVWPLGINTSELQFNTCCCWSDAMSSWSWINVVSIFCYDFAGFTICFWK